jgi:hypothetical protein
LHDEYQPWEAYSVDEEDDDYNIVKEEADEATEDAAPPDAGNLLPEYQALWARRSTCPFLCLQPSLPTFILRPKSTVDP